MTAPEAQFLLAITLLVVVICQYPWLMDWIGG